MEYQFNISNVKLRIIAPEELKIDEKWMAFASPLSVPDFCFRIGFVPELALPEGREVVVTDRVVVREREGKQIRCYRGSALEPVGLVIQEEAPGFFDLKTRPWGSWGKSLGNFLEAMALPHCLGLRGRLVFHCAYLLYQGEAILFTGRSGIGKTTQANLWVENKKARIINGDRGVLSIEKGRLRVWGLPFSGSSPHCLNHSAPVRAIIRLSQGKENQVKALSPVEIAKCLLDGCYFSPEFPQDQGPAMNLALDMAACTRGWHLSCLPRETAVEALYREIYT